MRSIFYWAIMDSKLYFKISGKEEIIQNKVSKILVTSSNYHPTKNKIFGKLIFLALCTVLGFFQTRRSYEY